jgi:cell wall assembly regulator SMI1
MKLRQHRRHRSRIQGKLTRSYTWIPVPSDAGGFDLIRVQFDLLPPPGPMHGQTYLVFENFITKPGVFMVGPEIVSLTPEGFVRGSQP